MCYYEVKVACLELYTIPASLFYEFSQLLQFKIHFKIHFKTKQNKTKQNKTKQNNCKFKYSTFANRTSSTSSLHIIKQTSRLGLSSIPSRLELLDLRSVGSRTITCTSVNIHTDNTQNEGGNH